MGIYEIILQRLREDKEYNPEFLKEIARIIDEEVNYQNFPEKLNPVGNDIFPIQDSEDDYEKKKVKFSTLQSGVGGIDTDAIHDNVAGEIAIITGKDIPHENDYLLIEDSQDSNNKKYILLGSLFGKGLPITSYLSDSNVQAYWKCDELEDNSYLYDFSTNEYDLTNNGFAEGQTCAVFGYGSKPTGTDRATRSLTVTPNLQITESITVEGYIKFEHLTFTNDTIINIGHDFYNNQYGVIFYLTSTDLVFKIHTNTGVYSCSTPISGFTIGNTYFIRGVFDKINNQLELWTQELGNLSATTCNTDAYPAHADFTDEFGTLTKADNTFCNGLIQYNVGIYDWVSLAKTWNTNSSAWDYSLSDVVYSDWSVHNIVRTEETLRSNNILPEKDGLVNLGSRFTRLGNIHAMKIFGDANDPNAIHDNVSGEINGISEKVTLENNDLILIEDSSDSSNKKKVRVSNLPTGWPTIAPTTTTDDTPTVAYTTTLNDDTNYILSARIIARRTDDSDYGYFQEEAQIRRESGGNATIIGSVFQKVGESTDSSWSVTWNTSGNDAQLIVTGAIGKTINWQPQIETENVS